MSGGNAAAIQAADAADERLGRKPLFFEIRLVVDALRKQQELNGSSRPCMLGALRKRYEECENRSRDANTNLDKLFEELLMYKEALTDTLSKLKDDRKGLPNQYEESRESDAFLASSFAGKIVKLEESLNE